MATQPRSRGDYTIGWISPLPKEQTAATAMLDQIHPDLDKTPNDHNIYTLGSIGGHNVVIAWLPKGKLGTSSAATVATRMVTTFHSIKAVLLVGIGGGIPPNVRLGDVVISTPVDEYPGVVQWDFGKAERDGKFKRTGSLNNPPSALLTALTKLETSHEMSESKIRQYLDEVAEKWPKLAPKYTSSGFLKDPLSTKGVGEDHGKRKDVRVHYGLIASGNQTIKDGELRDSLNNSLGGHVLCVEMEAAGLMNDFPCIVIRGVCDYADSQKNKDWQEYAAAVAAGCAKELLGYVTPTEILKWLFPISYAAQQSGFRGKRQRGTGQWLLGSTDYKIWLSIRKQTLFCPSILEARKTFQTSIIIHEDFKRVTKARMIRTIDFYCNFEQSNGQKTNYSPRKLLRHVLQRKYPILDSEGNLYNRAMKTAAQPSLDEISEVLGPTPSICLRILIIIDGLDECPISNDCWPKLLSRI
ncbi:purine and uridine phosphorylase [Hypoxylon sp. EC38]|nr:purine and uridine phosphorylase [Hypoxylon sp. EC38]